MTSRNESLVLLIRAKNLAKRELRDVAGDLERVDGRTQQLKATALQAGKVASRALLSIGVAATGLATASVAAFAKFEDKLNQSLAIMGDVAPAMRQQMSDTARAIAKSTRFGADQVAESYFFLASAGLNAQQSIAALPQVAAFAQAGMFDLARATDLATDAQSALGLKSDNAQTNLRNLGRVTDVLVKANTLANASVEQFSEALTNKAGAALKVVGKDIEEGVAVLAAFADQGIKGSEAGNALNIVFRELQTKAIKNKDAFEELGVAVFDADGDMRNIADIVGDLEGLLEGMSDEQKKATLAQLGFNDRSIVFIQTLLGTSDAIRQYEAELRKAGGTTKEVADKQMESLSAQFDLLKSKVSDTMIGLGEKLGPTIKADLLPAMNSLVDATGLLLENIGPALIKAISLAADAVSGFAMIMLDAAGVFDEDARKAKGLLVITRELNKGMGEGLDPAQRLAAAMITLGEQNSLTEDAIASLTTTIGATEEEQLEAIKITKEWGEQNGWTAEWVGKLGKKVFELEAKTGTYVDAAGRMLGTQEDATVATEDLTEALGEEESQLDDTEQALKDATEAQRELIDEMRAAIDPVFAAVDSFGQYQEAVAKVDELTRQGKQGTEEWAQAQLELAGATLDLQADLNALDTESLEQAIDSLSTALGISRDEARELLEQLGLLDGKTVKTVLKVDTVVEKGRIEVSSGAGRIITKNVSFLQHGGPLEGPAIVGEAGVELLVPGTEGTTVISNPGSNTGNFAEFAEAIARESARELASAMKENQQPRVVNLNLQGIDLSEGSRRTLLKIREGLRQLDLEEL